MRQRCIPFLRLTVRHTRNGQKEIARLWQQLSDNARPFFPDQCEEIIEHQPQPTETTMPRAVSDTPTSQSAAGFATKSMHQLISLCLVVIGCAGVARADDAAQMPTVVRVYHVGNLVSAEAIDAGSHFFGKATLQEWTSQYPATIKALDELCEIVDTMCENKPIATKSYAPSLSLIVRHTEDGQKGIAQLLQQLRDNDPPSIHLEFRSLALQRAPKDLPEGQQQRFNSLLAKSRFTKAESAELLSFIPLSGRLNLSIYENEAHPAYPAVNRISLKHISDHPKIQQDDVDRMMAARKRDDAG